MKKLLKLFLSVSLLFVAGHALGNNSGCCDTNNNNNCCDCACRSAYIPRSAGDNLVVQNVYSGYEYGADCFGGKFLLNYRFQQSRNDCNIARSLFGNSVLTFQGSNQIAAGTAAASVTSPNCKGILLADNFGLSPDLNQKIAFAPRIQNHVIDFELYLRLDELWEGLFFQINAPLVHSKWRLNPADGTNVSTTNGNCCDSNCTTDGNCNSNGCSSDCGTFPAVKTTTGFPAGCMGTFTAPIPPNRPADTAAATAFCGATGALSGNYLFGGMQTKWTAGSFCDNCTDDTKLASFNMILGYNFYECPDYHFGLYIKAAAPTGTDEDCCITRGVFQTRIGDNHWKLGGGIDGHAELYNCDDEHFVNLYFEGYLVHMFDRCQTRSFDFKNKGCLSRYMLLKEFNAAGTTASGALINGINFATRKVTTSVNVQGEGQIEFVYSNDCGFSAGLGWNIYGKGDESACGIGAACDSNITASRNFGFKGCAPVAGQCFLLDAGADNIAATLTITPTPLNSTQSNATICACGAVDTPAAVTTALTSNGNVCLDSCAFDPAIVVANATVATLTATTVLIADDPQPLAINSTTPVVFNTNATNIADILDINSGLVKSQVTNKIFGHLDYEWTDCDWTPKVYLGGEVEFASDDKCGAMNAWGVYLGGVVSF